MKRIAIALAAGAVLLTAGCGRPVAASSDAAGSVAGQPSAVDAGADGAAGPDGVGAAADRAPQGAGAQAAAPAAGPTGSARRTAPGGLLQAIRTGRHAGYDRLVLEFGGARVPEHQIRYVDRVTHDPSDRPVPLRGKAFLYLVFQGGTLDTAPQESDPAKAQRYPGPQRVTPNLPLLKEVAVAGDFERVLSFGIGLARPAGLRVQALTAPARLVVDFRYSPPRTLLWPDTTLEQAWAAQRAADDGHQPWRCSAGLVAESYASAVLGWYEPVVQAIGPQVYQVRPQTRDKTAILTVDRPARRGTPCDVWDVTGVAR